jgi:hypothetical protein
MKLKTLCQGTFVSATFLAIVAGVFSSNPTLGYPSNNLNQLDKSIQISADLNQTITPVNSTGQPMLIAAMTPRLTIEVNRIDNCSGRGSKSVEVKARRVQRRIKGRWSNRYQVETGESANFRAPDRGFSGDADAPVIEVQIKRKKGRKTCSTDSFFYNWKTGRGYAADGVEIERSESVTFNGITFVLESEATAQLYPQNLINALATD